MGIKSFSVGPMEGFEVDGSVSNPDQDSALHSITNKMSELTGPVKLRSNWQASLLLNKPGG